MLSGEMPRNFNFFFHDLSYSSILILTLFIISIIILLLALP